MNKAWALQDAKNRFSEVVEEAIKNGPQMITRRGRETVVIVPVKKYRELSANRKGNLVEYFARSPLRGVKLNLRRDKDTGRDFKF